MLSPSATTQSLLLVLVAGLVAITTLAIAAGAWTDRAGRSHGPEASLAAYSSAVAERDLQAALEQLVPEEREAAASFVEWELGNRYVVLESVIRTASALERLTTAGSSDDEARIAVVLEIQPAVGDRWRTTEEIPAIRVSGRWYMLKPPLQPAS
jgi:hypothetical protein